MSTTEWTNPVTENKYKIGTIGWEGPQGFSQIIDSLIPTYGLWGGPGWAPGAVDEEGGQIRPTDNSQIAWAINPCMNNSITEEGAVPIQCYSLLDAMCKSHDWSYYQSEEAEESGNETEAKEIIIAADAQLLKDIAAAITSGGSYNSPTGVYNEANDTWAPIMYAGSFDNTGIGSGLEI